MVPLCAAHIQKQLFTAQGLKIHNSKVHRPAPEHLERNEATQQAVANARAFGVNTQPSEPSKADWDWAAAQPFSAIVVPAGARTRRSLHASHVNTLQSCCDMLWPGMKRGERAAWWLHLALPRLVLACKGDGETMGVKKLGELFLAGKFEVLFKLAQAREEKLREARTQSGSSSRKVGDATAMLIKIGEYSRAMKRCSSKDGQRDVDDSVIDQLKALHPTSGAICAEDLITFKEAAKELTDSTAEDDKLMLSPESLAAAIRLAPRGSAGSGSGWIFEHYKALTASSDEQLGELCQSVQMLISGKLSAEITEALGSCTLIALAKPDGGTRPIAIGEVLRRLAGKAICYQLKKEMSTFFFPAQYGVQTRGGCEQILHTIRSHHHLFPNDVLLRLDCKNAFNTVSRTRFLRELLSNKSFRAAFPFVAQFYLPTCPLYVVGKDGSVAATIPSTSGTQQGDPLGPFLFALAIQSCITEVLALRGAVGEKALDNRLCVLAYLDDIHIIGPAEDVALAFSLFKEKFGKVDLELSGPTPKRARGKNFVWSSSPEELAKFVAAVPEEDRVLITECPDGYVVLGVFYGPTAANEMYEKLLDAEDSRSLAYKLAGLDILLESKLNYEAWLLLLFCVAPSVGYVQRCAPPSETLRKATTADDLLRSYVVHIASLPEGCFSNP